VFVFSVCSFSCLPEQSKAAPVLLLLLFSPGLSLWEKVFLKTGDRPVVVDEILFIVAVCMLKKYENVDVALGLNMSFCRHVFTRNAC
jgi:hypothetical protein